MKFQHVFPSTCGVENKRITLHHASNTNTINLFMNILYVHYLLKQVCIIKAQIKRT